MTDLSAACSTPVNTPSGLFLTAADRDAIASWQGHKGYDAVEWHDSPMAPNVVGIIPPVTAFTPFSERGAVAWSVWRDVEGVIVEHVDGEDSWRFETMAEALAALQAAEGQDDELAA